MKFECGLKYSCRLALEGSVPESETEGSEVTQSCPTRSDPMDCSLQGSPIHGISQARVLEWGAIAFSEGRSASNKFSQIFFVESLYFSFTFAAHIFSFAFHFHRLNETKRITEPLVHSIAERRLVVVIIV